ncbi:MAG: hypothetical protein IPM29_15990 [Planctomycetes bacterium]|nr:hypothetical protein [Planctomycetota bacterium]
MRSPLLLAIPAFFALAAGSLSAQALSLTTTFANNNGGSAGGAVYFDLTAFAGINIQALDINTSAALGTPGTIDIYAVRGTTYAGNEPNATFWGTPVLAGEAFVAAGSGQPTNVQLSSPLLLAPGQYAIAIVNSGGHAYTNGNGTNQRYADQFLQLDFGSASNAPFTGSPFTPRVWNGTVYYTPASGNFAQAIQFGSGCGGGDPASFYEVYLASNPFDLSGFSFTMIWNGTSYAVIPGASPVVQPTGSPRAMADDVVVQLALPWSIPTQAGNTSSVWLSSNGFLTFNSNTNSQLTESVSGLLNDALTRLAFMWDDLNPAAGGAVYTEQDPTTPGLYHITFQGVPEFSIGGSNDVQITLQQGGSIEVKYGNCSVSDCLVGYSRGSGSRDPGATDISALTGFLLGDDRPNLKLASLARPVLGQTARIEVRDIAASSLAGVVNYGIEIPTPIDLTAIGAPNCSLYVSALAGVGFPLTQANATQSLPLPNVPGFAGIHVGLQAVLLNRGVNTLGVAASNGLRWILDVN